MDDRVLGEQSRGAERAHRQGSQGGAVIAPKQ